MTHPSEQFAAQTIAALREASLPERLETDAPIVPGVYFSWDTSGGEAALKLTSGPGLLVRVEARVAKPPRWFSFNLSLGKALFAPGDVLGMAVELEGGAAEDFPLVIRSTRNGEIGDTVLQDSLKGAEDRVVRTVLHTVDAADFLSREPAFHTLVMRLPKRDFALAIRDLRFFVLPAARGQRSQPATLSSFGGQA
ncbi:hypothetical protein [Actibacterium sp. MT2.3-13A]|uniref:hypothetical protein n=1 Tax=Actibacterium sp. MT2.3-13A TaxID=2828332 RepID=UPI001BA8255E|nr:hypothetical protein [Actibacterium sp. MT2.3-13A]